MKKVPSTADRNLAMELLHYGRGLPWAEIAKRYGLTAKGAADAVSRARAKRRPPPPEPEPVGVAAAVLAVQPRQCRWPIGAAIDTFRFCGATVAKGSYCPTHAKLATVPVKRARPKATGALLLWR
jgi:hypothetical protein